MSETGNITLSAGGRQEFKVGYANYLYCYDQAGLVQVELMRDNSVLETHIVERLTLLDRRTFDSFRLKDKSGSSNAVRFFYGQGEYRVSADRSLVTIDDTDPVDVNVSGGSVLVSEKIANQVSDLADVTVTSTAAIIAAADSTRLSIALSIPEDEPNGIRIGGSSITASRGFYVPPGAMVFLSMEDEALYAIRDGSSDVAVSLMELERV